MKDFYLILQIERNASKQTIKQAYKRLARKYHPDLFAAVAQEDQFLLEKIQEVNEAYRVLSDDEKRKEYDLALKTYEEKVALAESPFERRSLLVKCAQTKRTYKMLLARKKNTKDKYEITGFESLEKPLLSDNVTNFFAKASSAILKKPREIFARPKRTDYSFKTNFYTDNPIVMDDIVWRGQHHCPDCDTPSVQAGEPSGWYVCGNCRQLFYADKFTVDILKQKVRSCPWCGVKNKITPNSGGQQWRIRGQESSESQGKDQNLLVAEKPKALGDGKNK